MTLVVSVQAMRLERKEERTIVFLVHLNHPSGSRSHTSAFDDRGQTTHVQTKIQRQHAQTANMARDSGGMGAAGEHVQSRRI